MNLKYKNAIFVKMKDIQCLNVQDCIIFLSSNMLLEDIQNV